MRYRDIIDFEHETQAEKDTRYSIMYGDDGADDLARHVETQLLLAKAAKLRAEALAKVREIEAEYEELALDAEQELIGLLVPSARNHPDG